MGSSLDFSGWLCIEAVCKFPDIWILHKVGKFVFQVLYFPLGERLFSFASSPNTLLSSMNWLFHSYCAKGSLNLPNKPGWLAAADFRLGLVWNGVGFSISKSAMSNDRLAVGSPRRMACNFTESWGAFADMPILKGFDTEFPLEG